MERIKIKYFGKGVAPIKHIQKGDWIDLRAAEHIEMEAGEYRLIPLGVGMILPEGFEAHVLPRSSTFKKYGVIQVNSMGIIDNSYSGDADQWMLPVLAMRDTVIPKNERICQFRIMRSQPKTEFLTVETLNEDSRGGFGSTGTV